MPTSTYCHIPTVVGFLLRIMPTSILDVGLGNGKMGFIARDLLDVMVGQRHKREDWEVRIDGVEIFSGYIQGHQKAIYDNIFIGDAFEVVDTLGHYDLIILGDVVEHLEKEKAVMFMDKCAAHGDYMIICLPLSEKWKQPAMYGNPHEEHLSFWKYEEIEPFRWEEKLFSFPNIGDYGCFLVKHEDYIHHRLRRKVDELFSEGKKDEALAYMEESLAELPPHIMSEFVFVDLLLKSNQIRRAMGRLMMITRIFPGDRSAKHYLQVLREKMRPAMNKMQKMP